jgi:transcriptional regulator GlxA family with amidase domain
VVHSPRADLRLDIEPFSLLLLRLNGGFVDNALNQRFSRVPPLETWATALSNNSPTTATLRSLCFWMAKELERPMSPLLTQRRVAASFERTLLSLFIECLVEQHPSAGDIKGSLSELHVKCAEDWIDANLAEPIGAEEVAAAIGVDTQALVETFKRIRGRSLVRTILQRRLERAREVLMSAGEETTVTDIAVGLGFCELGRFAVRYREQFGEKPSETLARALGNQPKG